MGTTEQCLTEHPWDVFGSSTGGSGRTHEPLQLEEVGSHWYVVCTSQIYTILIIQTHLVVPSLLRRWKRLEAGMDQSAETLRILSERFKSSKDRWLKAERKAQLKRSEDCTVMDIYDTATTKHMSIQYSVYAFG